MSLSHLTSALSGTRSSVSRNLSRCIPNSIARTASNVAQRVADVQPELPSKESKIDACVNKARALIQEHNIKTGPFAIIHLDAVTDQLNRWNRLFPRVKPYYAIKSFPDPEVISLLGEKGAGFDCASQGEIELVQKRCPGISAERLIFANPVKPPAHLEWVRDRRVPLMTADSPEEIEKIAACYPEAEVVLRILPDDRHSTMPFGSKFGASLDACVEVFRVAAEKNVKIVGVSFHVGSGAKDVETFAAAVSLARKVFDMGAARGFHMNFLDIGGGFQGSDDVNPTVEQISERINPMLNSLFPSSSNVKIISEPGRYFSASAATLIASVIGVRKRNGKFAYSLDQGCYGVFSNVIWDFAFPEPVLLRMNNRPSYGSSSLGSNISHPSEPPPPDDNERQRGKNLPVFPCDLFGPTCDSLDKIRKDIKLPEMMVGDFVVFPFSGAYTLAGATEFNGFPIGKIFYERPQ